MHKLHHQLFSSSSSPFSPTAKHSHLQDLNIPPRKLLSRRTAAVSAANNSSAASSEPMPDSPDELAALMHKFLPFNGDGSRRRGNSNNKKDDDFDPDADPYSSDQFRMFEFKIRRCTRSRSHDWTDCPFAHPGEKARRRDPRKYHYSGTVCPEYRRGGCTKGDECEFAHGVFECRLHPSRYRTEACKDGKSCKRKVCFFAHSPRELRVLPPQDDSDFEGNNKDHHQQYCCKCCSLSPTSTLMGMSHFSSSPPMSPTISSSPPSSPTVKGRGGFGYSRSSVSSPAASRYASDLMAALHSSAGEHLSLGPHSTPNHVGGLSYEDIIINEIVNSLGAMNLTHRQPAEGLMAAAGCDSGLEGGGCNNLLVNENSNGTNLKYQKWTPWVDVNLGASAAGCSDVDEHYSPQQEQYNMSPSATISDIQSPIHDSSPMGMRKPYFSSSSACTTPVGADFFSRGNAYTGSYGYEDKVAGLAPNTDPDLGWVNDLLM